MTGTEGFWALVETNWPDPCPIHADGCLNPEACIARHQAACAEAGLPPLDTGSEA